MPRGIPKDPNHPRNQHRNAAAAPAADAPKRRGRPPGSKNKAAQAAAPAPVKHVAKQAPKKQHKESPTKMVAEVAKGDGFGADIHYHQAQHEYTIRENITTLSRINNPSDKVIKAIEGQVEQLLKLTEEKYAPAKVEEESSTETIVKPAPVVAAQGPSNGATPSQTSPLPAPPNFMPPPFPAATQQ